MLYAILITLFQHTVAIHAMPITLSFSPLLRLSPPQFCAIIFHYWLCCRLSIAIALPFRCLFIRAFFLLITPSYFFRHHYYAVYHFILLILCHSFYHFDFATLLPRHFPPISLRRCPPYYIILSQIFAISLFHYLPSLLPLRLFVITPLILIRLLPCLRWCRPALMSIADFHHYAFTFSFRLLVHMFHYSLRHAVYEIHVSLIRHHIFAFLPLLLFIAIFSWYAYVIIICWFPRFSYAHTTIRLCLFTSADIIDTPFYACCDAILFHFVACRLTFTFYAAWLFYAWYYMFCLLCLCWYAYAAACRSPSLLLLPADFLPYFFSAILIFAPLYVSLLLRAWSFTFFATLLMLLPFVTFTTLLSIPFFSDAQRRHCRLCATLFCFHYYYVAYVSLRPCCRRRLMPAATASMLLITPLFMMPAMLAIAAFFHIRLLLILMVYAAFLLFILVDYHIFFSLIFIVLFPG